MSRFRFCCFLPLGVHAGRHDRPPGACDVARRHESTRPHSAAPRRTRKDAPLERIFGEGGRRPGPPGRAAHSTKR